MENLSHKNSREVELINNNNNILGETRKTFRTIENKNHDSF